MDAFLYALIATDILGGMTQNYNSIFYRFYLLTFNYTTEENV